MLLPQTVVQATLRLVATMVREGLAGGAGGCIYGKLSRKINANGPIASIVFVLQQ